MRRTLVIVGVVACVLLAPGLAAAHPLGNFTINRYAGIEVTPGQVRIDYVVDMAEIPTVQVRPEMDADGDGEVTDAERAAWATRTAPDLLPGLHLEIEGRPVPLDVVSASARFRPGQGGLDILRLEAAFSGPAPALGDLSFSDGNYADRIGWREVTAVGADGTGLTSSSVPARSVSNALLSYPQDLLSNPLDVTTATVSFRPGPSTVVRDGDPNVGSGTRPDVTGGAFAGLVGRSGPFMAVGLLLALGFGALHALGPGHGKTLMAAYLVGAGGGVRHAAAVGVSVAVMHTASVLALGFVVLTLSRDVAPERVYPWLGLLSGLIALGLGASLLVSRLGRWSFGAGQQHDREHGHDHGHGHDHDHRRPHHVDGPLSRRSLTALAVAGGILPSPTALVVLLAAVALERVAYGLALIAAFSLGLAAALIVVGVLALRAGNALSRRVSGRVARAVPVFSAASIALMGLVLTLRGFTQV
jgi:ABC-type nickel/cobalt efflux system permease component RcnA